MRAPVVRLCTEQALPVSQNRLCLWKLNAYSELSMKHCPIRLGKNMYPGLPVYNKNEKPFVTSEAPCNKA